MTCKKGHFFIKKFLFKENFKICSKNKRKLIKMTFSEKKAYIVSQNIDIQD